jgi:hypothetical protein
MADDNSAHAELESLLKLPIGQLTDLPQEHWDALPAEARDRLANHLLDHMTPEDRERATTFAHLRGSLVHDFGEGLGTYAWMLTSRDFAEAGEWAERLALRWREVGERERLEQLGTQLLPEKSMELFGALLSSLVLASSAEPQRRELALQEQELGERVVLAGREGVWANWEEVIERAQHEDRQPSGGKREVEVKTPKRLSGPLLTPGRRKRHAVAVELSRLLEDELGASAEFYTERLLPDGDRLSPERAAEARDRLEAAAACSRIVDRERFQWNAEDWSATKLALAELRSMETSLLLALSEDPARRSEAAPVDERRMRLFMLVEMSAGASREEAYERLLVASRERGET